MWSLVEKFLTFLPFIFGRCDTLFIVEIMLQFVWLEEHFTTRHAGKAQPYMCLIEGCALRFTLKRSLEEHLRTGHEKSRGSLFL